MSDYNFNKNQHYNQPILPLELEDYMTKLADYMPKLTCGYGPYLHFLRSAGRLTVPDEDDLTKVKDEHVALVHVTPRNIDLLAEKNPVTCVVVSQKEGFSPFRKPISKHF